MFNLERPVPVQCKVMPIIIESFGLIWIQLPEKYKASEGL
jgi:hypothetical protein